MQNNVTATTLYYRSGSSDKVYQASVEPVGSDLFMVRFAYGRRGMTLTSGVKTSTPVCLAKARTVFDKLVKSKVAKGYTPGAAGTPYVGSDLEARDTGIRCQLLNPVDEVGLERCLKSPEFLMQEKFDGRRMLVRKEGHEVTGINRRGLVTALPETIVEGVHAMPGEFIIDGEAVADTLHAFDLLASDGRDLRGQPYRYRFERLALLLATHRTEHIRAVATAATPEAKQLMLDQLRDGGREGAVFKGSEAPYTHGRPSSGGAQLKFKFHKSASCLVTGRNGDKQSVSLAVFAKHRLLDCGNVAIPANHTVPAEGTVVEVRYLYAVPGSNALYQPVYLGPRDDLGPIDCVIDQFRYKAA